jgi:hypothetical protein
VLRDLWENIQLYLVIKPAANTSLQTTHLLIISDTSEIYSNLFATVQDIARKNCLEHEQWFSGGKLYMLINWVNFLIKNYKKLTFKEIFSALLRMLFCNKAAEMVVRYTRRFVCS